MRIQLVAHGFELNTELEKYAHRKLAVLNRRAPRASRPEVVCTVRFTQKHTKATENKICSLTLELPLETLKAEETTQHMYAALDIVVERIVQQLHDYKLRNHRRGGLRVRRLGGSELPDN